jgi:hypothetical protein
MALLGAGNDRLFFLRASGSVICACVPKETKNKSTPAKQALPSDEKLENMVVHFK